MEADEDSGRDLKNLFRKIKKKFINRNFAVFLFFLLLSFIFWFINALSKDIDGIIKYPVRYINFPKDLALVNELPDKLSLDVKGHGYSVLKARIRGNKTPLVIDVGNSGLSIRQNTAELDFYISSFNLKESFKRQLKADFIINSIYPDSLNFIFDKIIKKKVPVNPDIKVNPERQFMVSGNIVCEPDSVEIAGPRALIDTIMFVKTEYHEFNQVDDWVTKNLDIESIRKVGISHKKVEITVPVEQFTEEKININIRILNKPDTADVKLFPDMVSINFNIALSDYNRIQETPLEAVVDMKDLDVRTVERLKVELVNLSPFISSVRYTPKQVEYIIEKK